MITKIIITIETVITFIVRIIYLYSFIYFHHVYIFYTCIFGTLGEP